MKTTIREKRKLNFSGKQITPKDIRIFASIIENEAEKLKTNKEDNFYLIYSVEASDNSSYESQSILIFEENEIIEKKTIQKLTMKFNTITNSKNIELQLVHSITNDKSENFILVSGDDTNWVNGILARFSEAISLAKSRPQFKIGLGWISFFILILFNILYFRLFFSQIKNVANLWFMLGFFGGPPILSIFLCAKLADYLYALWPAIELQTGPEYLQIPMRSRKKTIFILTTVIVPLVLGLIYDIIKSICC